MKIKKYILITLILLILINITCISATENNTSELETITDNNIEINENTLNTDIFELEANNENPDNLNNTLTTYDSENTLSQNNNDDDTLSEFINWKTEITLTVNDTSNLETTGNITINMHISFTVIEHSGEFSSQKINIYENNTLIKTLTVGEQNLPELATLAVHDPAVNYHADLQFDYTVHDHSFLTTTLMGHYSNTLEFEKVKNIIPFRLNSTSIIIDNIHHSNETWTNTPESMKKALEIAKNNGTITLNNINISQDTTETIQINKNITIIGNNAGFILQKTRTLFEISQNSHATFINLTFSGNSRYIISNKGKLTLVNCTFKDNNQGLIINNGEMEIDNCSILDVSQFYHTQKPTVSGLITNYGHMKITNAIFNNNNPLPYNLPSDTADLNGIIYNKGFLTMDNVNFTNINYRLIYNDGELTLNSTLFKDIISSCTNPINTVSTDQQLTPDYTYSNYKVQSTDFQTIVKEVNGGAIYNNNVLNISNSKFQTITATKGGAIYSTKQLTITNTTFKSTAANDGGAIYSTKQLIIENTTLTDIQSKSNGAIYNTGTLNINNTQISNAGNSIYNTGTLNITHSQIRKSSRAVYNTGTLYMNNTVIRECSGVGSGIYNMNIANIENCQMTNNHASAEMHMINDGGFSYFDKIYSGVIYTGETGKTIISKSIIKDNTVNYGHQDGCCYFCGVIKNEGETEILGCIIDNNTVPTWYTDRFLYIGGASPIQGGIVIYNTGKLTLMYNYILNVKMYTSTCAVGLPAMFLNNQKTANINYNYFTEDPYAIIRNANPNYYFIPAFEDDYYPVKLNENTNITLTLGLTNGVDKIDFDDWDKMLTPGFNTTITTLNENGEYINITTFLKDKYTFNFNYTGVKGEYMIYAKILHYVNYAIVDVGKEFPEMTVTYNNITYNDGGNITFHVKVTGNLTAQPTGNVTFTYNNKKVTLNLTDGECNYTISEVLKPANYTMRIDYNGDNEYFRIIKQFYTFTVYKIPNNITITAKEIKVDEKGEITITVTPDSTKLTGYLYLTKGDTVRKFKADTQGSRTLKPKNFEAGIWNATVIFDEDEYYMGGSASTLFIVSRYETSMTVESSDIDYGDETLNITITPGDVRGEATLTINGVNMTIFINDTMTPVTITGLDNGTYHVTVYYPGDNKYLPCNASTVFSVSRKTSSIDVNIINNPDLTGNIIVRTNSINCTGTVGLYINNDLYMENLTGGTVNFTVKFKRGNNYIYIQYLGDDYYSRSTWNATRYIEGKAIITQNDTVLNEQELEYFKINLTDTDANPYEYTTINVTFQNQTFNLTTDEHGMAYLPIKTKAGVYTIETAYKNATATNIITVAPTKIIINIKDILAGERETINATLTGNASGNVTFTVDGTDYVQTLANGSAGIDVPDLGLGEHHLTVTYSGDGNYSNQTINMAFHIKNSLSWTAINIGDSVYGEIITVKANVIEGATGTVTFTIDNQAQTVNLTGNQATATFKNIQAGNKLIAAHYNGDAIYQGSTDTATFNIAKADSALNITTSELKIGENILITAMVNPDATGNVTFRILGLYSPRNRTVTGGASQWLISPLTSGSYNLIVTYNGDNNYNSITQEKLLILNQTKTTLTVSIATVNADEDLIVKATLIDENGNKITDNITLEINGKYYKVIIKNGEGTRNLGQFKAGTYNYKATYYGTTILAQSQYAGKFQVKANKYKLTVPAISQYYQANKVYKIRLTNNNKAVSGAKVKVILNKQARYLTTNKYGYVSLKITLKPGTYYLTAQYANVKVTKKAIVKPTLITKNMAVKTKTLKYTAKVLNTNGKVLKNKKVTFKFQGKTYSAKTNSKGIASITVKNPKTGTYKIQTTYAKQTNTNTITVK